MDVSEKRLVILCREGKTEGFDLLYKKYENLIYSICYRYTASRDDALDLLQEVYIKLYKSIHRVDENKPVLPWVKKITVNTCLNYLRDNKSSTVSLNAETDDDGNSIQDLVASTTSVEEQVTYKDTKHIVREMIAGLPRDMKMAVILRHEEGMSYDNIAKIMSCTVGAVKTNIFRGRRMLKEKLKKAGIWEV